MKPIISIEGVGKKYSIGSQEPYVSLRDSIAQVFSRPQKDPSQEFWALRDVSFDIAPGESVGIVGRNGSGKSTLLKILSQITPPTTGTITMRGRVASLLEVGTGFHPELTGRENIYLNGAILGMSQAEIKRKFDEIIDFAGVEKFLDTPVKRYSSGMSVRLAFAVAAHLEPEILIIDEVLAVGDSEFQKKCLDKMGRVIREEGRTILFVSHNLLTVQSLCKRAVLLERGRVKEVGETSHIIDTYVNSRAATAAHTANISRDRNNPGELRFTGLTISNDKGSGAISSDDRLRFAMRYSSDFKHPITDVRVVISVFSKASEQMVLRLDSDIAGQSLDGILQPEGEILCETAPVNLSEGKYTADIDFLIQGTSCDNIKRAGEFDIETVIGAYGFRILPDRTVCDHVTGHSFTQLS